MTIKEFKNLKCGDVVWRRASEGAYVVNACHGGRVTAVKTVELIYPEEWEVVKRRRIRSSKKK